MQLMRREKLMLVILALLIALVAAYQARVKPAIERVATLERVLGPKNESLSALRARSAEYLALKDEIGRIREKIQKQTRDFDILSFIEDVGKKCGLSENIVYMNLETAPINDTYVGVSVEVKMENVALQEVTEFLLRLRSTEAMIGVKSLRIKLAREGGLLDVVAQVSTLSLTEAGSSASQVGAISRL
ncbi:MAG: type II secretion system protein M [Planctomycetes bacterium]|nr:type II secretion system protein M [Planctomycetota bacterium]